MLGLVTLTVLSAFLLVLELRGVLHSTHTQHVSTGAPVCKLSAHRTELERLQDYGDAGACALTHLSDALSSRVLDLLAALQYTRD